MTAYCSAERFLDRCIRHQIGPFPVPQEAPTFDPTEKQGDVAVNPWAAQVEAPCPDKQAPTPASGPSTQESLSKAPDPVRHRF